MIGRMHRIASHASCRFGFAPGARRPGAGRLFLLRCCAQGGRGAEGRFARDARRGLQRRRARHEGARVPEAAARVQDADLGLCRWPRRRRAGRRRQGGDGRRTPLRSPAPSRPTASAATCWRRSGGSNSNFGTEMGERPLVQSLSTLACFGARPGYFRSELMATLEDHRPRRHSGRQADRLVGGRVRPDPVHALELPEARGRRRRRAARHRRFGRRRARLDRQLFRQVRLAFRRSLGLRGQAAARLFRALGTQGEAADVRLGGARDRADRRAAARRRRRRAPPAGRPRPARPFW